MAITLSSLSDLAAHGFDDIIDVRAPAEYAEDHLPGAISLPVLNDAERARVGTIYKQVSPFTARKLGAALVARNAARHLEDSLADRDGGWRPLVYCWRGGQRSGSFAVILSQIGWRVETIAGGYKAWRSLVVRAVQDDPFPCPVIVLDGNTGSAKTDILKALPAHGVQMLDLEGLANHRGSLFGHMGAQPSQKAFEGRIAVAIAQLDPARPVVIEAESSRVGDLSVPPSVWKAMRDAPRIAIDAPQEVRAAYLTRAYADLTTNPARLSDVIHLLRHAHAAKRIEEWQALARDGAFAALATGLMQDHYDPRYAKHRARMGTAFADLPAPDLSPAGIDGLAARIAGLIPR